MKLQSSLHRLLVRGLLLLAAATVSAAQLGSDPASLRPAAAVCPPRRLPMNGLLTEIEREARAGRTRQELVTRFGPREVAFDPAGRVQVDVVGREGTPLEAASLLAPFGGEVTTSYRHVADAWVPAGRLSELAAALPPGIRIRTTLRPQPDDVQGEGPGVANTTAWRDSGGDGTGLVIGVIDRGFAGWSAAQTSGDVPPAARVTGISLVSGSPFTGGSTHGTSCVEVLYDHCPGATYIVYRVDSVADLGTAVGHAIGAGVDIISMSQSWYNTGWSDDSGLACAAAHDAADAGILFFTSAGNRARQHWEGAFQLAAGTTRDLDWGDGSSFLPITLPPGGGGRFYLSWDTTNGTHDFDLYLYDDPDYTNLLASNVSFAVNDFEDFAWTNPSTTLTNTVYLVVQRFAGGSTDVEVFMHSTCNAMSCPTSSGAFPTSLQVRAGSNTSPSNTSRSTILSVGAVIAASYDDPAGADPVACYSSQGPTNDGALAPDIAGPTAITTFTDGANGFGGTSCATPSVAGIAGCLWSDNLALDATGVAWILRQNARTYRDWGATGDDDVYGAGGARLLDWSADTLFVDRSFGNVTDQPTWPYYHAQDAADDAASGGRLVFLGGGTYPESLTIVTPLRLEALGATASVDP